MKTFPTETELTRMALEHDCPACAQPSGNRCRTGPVGEAWAQIKRERYGLCPPTRYQSVKPHAERVTVAWRAWQEANA